MPTLNKILQLKYILVNFKNSTLSMAIWKFNSASFWNLAQKSCKAFKLNHAQLCGKHLMTDARSPV